MDSLVEKFKCGELVVKSHMDDEMSGLKRNVAGLLECMDKVSTGLGLIVVNKEKIEHLEDKYDQEVTSQRREMEVMLRRGESEGKRFDRVDKESKILKER